MTFVAAFCAAVCFAGTATRATAQNADQPGGASAGSDALLVFDATLVERLQQLQAEHRKTRDQALKDPKAWDDGRAGRAGRDRAELAKVWGNLVDTPDARARLRIHAEHMARLNRMLDLALADVALTQRIRAAIESELVKHAQNMQTLRAALRRR